MTLARFAQTADATIANTVTETTIVGAGKGSVTLNADELSPGKSIRLRAAGYFSDTGTPDLRVRAKIGSATIVDSGAIALTGGQSNAGWEVDIFVTCRTDGMSGMVITQGEFRYEGGTIPLVSTGTTTVDTTASAALDVTIEWGTADVANTLTCTNLTAEVLK